MKTVSVALKTHLAAEVTTICTCWRITRRDGTIFRFTDHDVDLVVDGDTYVAAVGYLRRVLGCIADYKVNRVGELLPWNLAGVRLRLDQRDAA